MKVKHNIRDFKEFNRLRPIQPKKTLMDRRRMLIDKITRLQKTNPKGLKSKYDKLFKYEEQLHKLNEQILLEKDK